MMLKACYEQCNVLSMLFHYNRLNPRDIHHNDVFNVFGKKRLVQNDALNIL